jgi:hypothetical protein
VSEDNRGVLKEHITHTWYLSIGRVSVVILRVAQMLDTRQMSSEIIDKGDWVVVRSKSNVCGLFHKYSSITSAMNGTGYSTTGVDLYSSE